MYTGGIELFEAPAKEIVMEHSKYRIVYTPGREWEYKVFRRNDDITSTVRNNPMDDIVFELINMRSEKEAVA